MKRIWQGWGAWTPLKWTPLKSRLKRAAAVVPVWMSGNRSRWSRGRSGAIALLLLLLLSGGLGRQLERTWAATAFPEAPGSEPAVETAIATPPGMKGSAGDRAATVAFTAFTTERALPLPSAFAGQVASLDVVPEDLRLGQQLFLRECATCHIAPSPAVLPVQTWANLLPRTEHYGVQIQVLQSPAIDLMWDYVRFASRPIREGETPPDRIRDSRFFWALHPQVEVERVDLGSCVSCHPNAWDYDYRTLSPEWTEAP